MAARKLLFLSSSSSNIQDRSSRWQAVTPQNAHDIAKAKYLSWQFWSIVGSKLTPFSEQKTYKYGRNISRILQFKMQFKVITGILLLFAAQTIAKSCTSLSRLYSLYQGKN